MCRDNHSHYFCFLCAQKVLSYLRKITVELLDYFTDVIATFLGLGTFQLCCGLCRDGKLSDCIKNILICVPKMNGGLTGFERREGD